MEGAVAQDGPHRVLHLAPAVALDLGLLHVLGPHCGVVAVEAQRGEHCASNVFFGQRLLRGCFDRGEQRGARQQDLQEVVEVAGLQRGVLPVVREAEHFLGLRRELLVLLVQIAQRSQRQHGGGRASALARQRGQAQRVLAAADVGDTARQTEAEAAGDEPGVQSAIAGQHTIGSDLDRLGQVFFLGRLHAPLAIGTFLNPGLGIVFRVGGVPAAGGIRHEVAGLHAVVLVLAFFDAAHREGPPLIAVLVPDRDVFLATVAAEVHVVQMPATVARDELLPIQGHGPHSRCLQRREDLATARDELMQLEREQGLAGSVLDVVGTQQELLQVFAALLLR